MNDSQEELSLLALHLAGKYYKHSFDDYISQKIFSSYELLHKLYDSGKAKKLLQESSQTLKQCQEQNIFVINILDERYPYLLKQINNPPLVFFALGDVTLLLQEKISMVGTRKPSIAGRFLAAVAANHFSQKQVVVSGMAMGIDAICHRNAVKNKGTIAVLAHGFSHRYPATNSDLYNLVEAQQPILLLSEYPPETLPQRFHFPRRNRIIAGLSAVTIFVEGGLKSGAHITVNYALEQGREIYVLDHPTMLNNEGGRKWLADGALSLDKQMTIQLDKKESLADKLNHCAYLGQGHWLHASFAKKNN